MKTKLFAFLLLCSFIPLQAQDSLKVKYSHQLGLHAGLCTGAGISYRFWPGKLGIQATFVPIKTEENWKDLLDIQGFYDENLDVHYKQFISTALTCLLELKQYDHLKFFSYWGNHLLFTNDETFYSSGIGVGFAIEARVSYNIMVGYGAYDILTSFDLYPTIEMGVYYRFNNLR